MFTAGKSSIDHREGHPAHADLLLLGLAVPPQEIIAGQVRTLLRRKHSASGPMSNEIQEERKMRHQVERFLVCAILLSSFPALAQFSQQGPKLVGIGAVGTAQQGSSVSLSADGNTAIVGGPGDNGGAGAAWVWTRSGGVWTQQGPKLVGSGGVVISQQPPFGPIQVQQGSSVSISADGNTAIVGGPGDNGYVGAVWVWTRNGGVWTQQGAKLVGSGAVGLSQQGHSVSLSADGNTAIVGGSGDNGGGYGNFGAVWIWARSGGVWTQQGAKLVGSGAVGWNGGLAGQGSSVSLSADGNTAVVGGPTDNQASWGGAAIGAAWIWTRSGGVWTQQGTKLVGSGVDITWGARQGSSVSLSADGNTAIVGGPTDPVWGAAWVWTRSGGIWTQQGAKRQGSAFGQGNSVSLSATGNTAIVGAPTGASAGSGYPGAALVWTRSGNVWTLQGNNLVGSGAVGSAQQGGSVSLSADGNTAIVGGVADNGGAGAVWVFAVPPPEPNWVLKSPSNSPPGHFVHTMAYDAARGQVVLFGGASNGIGNDTWVWDGVNWIQKNPATSPPPRWFHVMTYDAARGQVVLFGGSDSANVLYSDTWVWDGTSWTQKSPVNHPPARNMHAMAYDAAHEQVVLFGGGAGSLYNDTWVWDGTNWTQSSPSNSPPPRDMHAMAYDATRGQVVLFGGYNAIGNGDVSDTWVWDGTNWTQKSPASSPSPRLGHVMAYDATRGQVVLFGGSDHNNVQYNNTWVWDGTNWTQKSPANSPPPRGGSAMTYDSTRGQVVLFGGVNNSAGVLLNDTWVWGSPSPSGTISVTTNLAAASFTITGPAVTFYGIPVLPPGTSGGPHIYRNAPAGTYTITYDAVNCYSTPPSETKTLTDGGVLTFSDGTYQGRATIAVSVQPAGATTATFSINPPVPGLLGNPPYPRVANNVWPQSYTVNFNPVPGFTTPTAQTSAPNSSCQLTFLGTYVQTVSAGTSTLTVTLSSNTNSLGRFTINDSQGKVIASSVSSFSSALASGKYTVKYAPLAGYYTPPDRTVVLAPPTPLNIQGIYRRLLLVSFTGWNNAPEPSNCFLSIPGSGNQYSFNQYFPGMTTLLIKALAEPVLNVGLVPTAFTFYTTTPLGIPLGDACTAPPFTTDHLEAAKWISDRSPTSDDVVAIVGHSYGGNRARLFVEQLKRSNVTSDLLTTVDPIDWDLCSVPHTLVDLLSGCIQTDNVYRASSAKTVLSFYQTIGVLQGSDIFPLKGYKMPNTILPPFNVGATHSLIDDDNTVQRTIIDALNGLIRGPKALTTTVAATPTRDISSLSFSVRVTATPFGSASGFGTAMGTKITSASLNGVPAANLSPSLILGNIVAGSSSSPVTLRFPTSAATTGSAVLLTVVFETSDGTQYTTSIRQVAP